MLFSRSMPISKIRKQKNRIFKDFKLNLNNKSHFRLKSFENYRLFLNHLKLISFFLKKCVSKFKRQSRKEYYKKLNEKNVLVKFRIRPLKDIMKRFSTTVAYKNLRYMREKKKFYLSKYRRIHNNYICFNTNKIPYTKKSTNSRMGKGKGNIKNWFIQITSGKTLFYLKRWNSKIAIYALKIIKMYLPGKNISLTPFLKKDFLYFTSPVFFI